MFDGVEMAEGASANYAVKLLILLTLLYRFLTIFLTINSPLDQVAIIATYRAPAIAFGGMAV
jgi:hypothetical protein